MAYRGTVVATLFILAVSSAKSGKIFLFVRFCFWTIVLDSPDLLTKSIS